LGIVCKLPSFAELFTLSTGDAVWYVMVLDAICQDAAVAVVLADVFSKNKAQKFLCF